MGKGIYWIGIVGIGSSDAFMAMPTKLEVCHSSNHSDIQEITISRNKTLPLDDTSETKTGDIIPKGYALKDVPSDGCCGYWAVLTAKKAQEMERTKTTICIRKNEILEILKQLADRIAYTADKENKSIDEIDRMDVINQLICEGFAKNYDDLYKKIKAKQMQLDFPLIPFLTDVLHCTISVRSKRKSQGNFICTFHADPSQNGGNSEHTRPVTVAMIHYSGDGFRGHYQAITPEGVEVKFEI
ncbi:MAG: hypothetical protein LBB11_03175 [Puniceicoccales bacterium]|jgi:hypothetical protein|nr:hypothetical protein [Puniceicoccales bacterium]